MIKYIAKVWIKLADLKFSMSSRVGLYLLSSNTNVDISDNVQCWGRPVLRLAQGSKVSIGRGTILNSSNAHNDFGINHAVVLRTTTENATIKIGDECGLSGTTLAASCGIYIGNRVNIGANTSILDSNLHDNISGHDVSGCAEIFIGDDCFIGANCIILAGTVISAGTLVAAGSILKGDYSAKKFIKGVLAK